METDFLGKFQLFERLTDEQLARLAAIVKIRAFGAEEVLFEQDDLLDRLYVIRRGRVRISRRSEAMGEEALAILGPDSVFGEMELVEPTKPASAWAITHTPCIVYFFPFEDLLRLFQEDRELALAVLWGLSTVLASRLRATNDKVMATFALALPGDSMVQEVEEPPPSWVGP